MEMISLDVTKNTLRASTPKKYAPTHPSLASTWHLPDPLRVVHSRLAMYLPHEVNEKEGSAKWDSDKNELMLTLPIIHNDMWNEANGI